MTISMQGILRVAVIASIALTQIAATPKKAPWPIPWNLYAHPQRLVDVGGRRLNLICSGTGSPTVVLDAGLGADASAWRLVQPRIALHTRVCSYDRAGMGFSEPAGAPRDAAAIASDLHSLLHRAGISPPYVLVGWSSAGLYTLLYADRYSDEVAGLVEVDPTTPYEDVVLPKIDQGYAKNVRGQYRVLEACAADVAQGKCPFFPGLAQYRKMLRGFGCPHVAPAACAASDVLGEHEMRASYWHDQLLESRALPKSMAEARAQQRAFGKLPLLVLTDSEQGDVDPSAPVPLAQQRADWRATETLQQRVAHLSAVGAQFVVAGSTHAIQLSQPAAVISANGEVLQQVQNEKQ